MSRKAVIALTICVLLVHISHCTMGDAKARQQDSFSLVNLTNLNSNAINYYRQSIYQQGPGGFLILVQGEQLFLTINGQIVAQADAFDERYRVAKTIASVPIGIFTLLHQQLIYENRTVVTPGVVGMLQQYLSLIPQAQASLRNWFRSNSSTSYFEESEVLRSSLNMVNSTLRSRRLDNTTLFNWAQEIGTNLPKVALKTAQYSVLLLHQRVKQMFNQWNITRTSADWNRFRVVIALNPDVRQNNLFEQYFSRLIGERDYLGRRVINVDLPITTTAMLNQAAIAIVDNLVGRYFEGNPLFMRKDWLADSAPDALDQILMPIPDDPNVITFTQMAFYAVIGTAAVIGITVYVIGLAYAMYQYNTLVKEEEERQRIFAHRTGHPQSDSMHEVPLAENQ